MLPNYTATDAAGSCIAVVLFLVLSVIPGYVTGWITNAFSFRNLTPPWRILLAGPLSIGLCPILLYWVGSSLPSVGIAAMFTGFWIVFLFLLLRSPQHERLSTWLRFFRELPWLMYFVPLIWIVIVIGSLIDIQLGPRLYFSVTAYDYSTRAPITEAITRAGVHPANPFFDILGTSPLRYHYFWFLMCSAVERAGAPWVDARTAMIASAGWIGLVLAALVPLYIRFFQKYAGSDLARRSVIGIALFVVTGLDIVPTIGTWVIGAVKADMEWWNEQVTSWLGSILWVPHHVAGLVAGLTGFLVAWDACHSEGSGRLPIRGAVLAGVCFASMVGMSIYVAFVFVIFLLLWTAYSLFIQQRRFTWLLPASGIVTCALVLPYLRQLSQTGSGGSFVKLTIRGFFPLARLEQSLHLSWGADAVLRLLALPLNYFLELGLFLVAAIAAVCWLRSKSSVDQKAAIGLAGVSVLICTFFRSGVISNNDLGMRGFLPAQFIFLLWTVDLLLEDRKPIGRTAPSRSFRRKLRLVLASLTLLGISGTIYELGLLRFYGMLGDSGIIKSIFSNDRRLGERTLAMRSILEQVARVTPRNAVLQLNPGWDYPEFQNGLYAARQIAAYDSACGTVFGGNPAACAAVYPDIHSLFQAVPGFTVERAIEVCRRLKIDAVIITDLDPAWKDARSWIWNVHPVAQNRFARAYVLQDPAKSESEVR